MTIAGDIYKYRIFFSTHSRPPFDPATRPINLFERDTISIGFSHVVLGLAGWLTFGISKRQGFPVIEKSLL
jgi:hypothetical protein